MVEELNALKVKVCNRYILCYFDHIVTVFHCCVVLILFVLKEFSTLIFYFKYAMYVYYDNVYKRQ
jgi:hypothetical protein